MFVQRAALVSAAALCATLSFSMPASADANHRDCSQMAQQVATAIDAAQPGKAKDAALSEQRNGRNLCSISMYDDGVSHYLQALRILKTKS